MKKNKPVSSQSPRVGELDVFRGLAALGIVFYHYTCIYPLSYNSNEETLFTFPLGRFGIHLFFMISGFVIFMTIEKITRPFDFIVSRFARLFPCYWVSVFLTYFIVKNFSLFTSNLMEVNFKEALFNLTMAEEWLHVKSIDEIYWTLEAELSFYFLMFFVLVTKKTKYIEIFGSVWLVIMVLNKFFGPTGPVFSPLNDVFYYLLSYGDFFFAGILFYNLKTRGNAWYRHLGLAACLLVHHIIGLEALMPVVFLFILFYLFVYGWLTFIVQKPLIWLGTISYSLYLVHSKIGFIILQHLDVLQYLGTLHLNPFFKLSIPVIASLTLATLMTYLIEKPAMKWIKKIVTH